MRRYAKNAVIEVAWQDIVQDPAWKSEEDAGKRPKSECLTVGYYLKHDKEFLYLSHCISYKERDKTTIPLGCIKKVVKLK